MKHTTSLLKAGVLALLCLYLTACAQITASTHGFRLDKVVPTVEETYGEGSFEVVRDWAAMLSLLQGVTEQNKIKVINEYFNRKLHFDTDMVVWEKEDYWATPIESLLKQSGDCDDYAIGKYFSLKYAGVPTYKLRMIYGKLQLGGSKSKLSSTHIVLAYYANPGDEPLILDNMMSEIRPLSQRTDFTPIFSFNADGVWSIAANQPRHFSAEKIMKWNDVFKKMRLEGFEQI